ncbi:MAG: molybdopterin biosynthesis protein MoeB [Burkholderiales bacterium PBB4]|nr:MAG: molybdopterin biosynthesis protein MoeB [Burkholderiales bacterium PBB4]
MQDAELLRYSRHILLDDIGIEGQDRILGSSVLIVGAGGLGSPAAMYLACAGLGHVVLVDHDTVDLTNLQRQIAHHTESVGRPKVDSAAETLSALNPTIRVTACNARADGAFLDQWVPQVDVVLDCCDNFSTRQAVNAACVRHQKPLVSGAAVRFEGQISVYAPSDGAQDPCYACVFPPDASPPDIHCATMGVFAPLVGIVGAMQAAEALKLITGAGQALVGRMLMLDGRAMEWTELRLPRNLSCTVCGPTAAEGHG